MNGEIGMRALHAFYAGKILMESEVAALLADVDADDLDADDLDADDGAYPVSDSMVENLVAQFDNDVVREAANMGHHYRLFYAFEHFVRRVVYEQLLAIYDNDWWGHVPQTVQQNASANRQREIDEGVTARSDELIDYTTFGELSTIIDANYAECFGDLLNSRKASTKILARLNLLRGPIAHFSPLAADEVLRLELSIRDWFRLMS